MRLPFSSRVCVHTAEFALLTRLQQSDVLNASILLEEHAKAGFVPMDGVEATDEYAEVVEQCIISARARHERCVVDWERLHMVGRREWDGGGGSPRSNRGMRKVGKWIALIDADGRRGCRG